jgi:hypothetical protein
MQWPIINAPRQHRSPIQSARPLYATLRFGQRPQPRSRRRAHVVRPQQWPTVGWPPMECWTESLPLPPPRLSREETQRLILLTLPVTREQATQKASRQLWRGTASLGTGQLGALVSPQAKPSQATGLNTACLTDEQNLRVKPARKTTCPQSVWWCCVVWWPCGGWWPWWCWLL